MGTSVIKVPQYPNADYDYIAFSFMGKHSFEDFGIIRTSDGSRYNQGLNPNLNDKTTEVPNGDGMYYFGTQHKQKEFPINFAFDGLTEQKLSELKAWLNGKEMGDLWFSETPYKVYTAKPTGQATIKAIPFEKNGQRIYKGEGSVSFTAYWPYGHTPKYVTYSETNGFLIAKSNIEYIFPKLDNNYSSLKCLLNNKTRITFIDTNGKKTKKLINNGDIYPISDGLFSFIPEQEVLICFQYWVDEAQETEPPYVKFFLEGKNMSSYATFYNKEQWQLASGLTDADNICTGENPGDVPAPFVLTADIAQKGELTFKVGELSITVTINKDEYNKIEWNSKTGLVYGYHTTSTVGKKSLIPYTGVSVGAIPVGGAQISVPEGITYQLEYDYWYY